MARAKFQHLAFGKKNVCSFYHVQCMCTFSTNFKWFLRESLKNIIFDQILFSCIIHFCLVKQTLLLLRTKFNLKRFSHIGQLYDIRPTLCYFLVINIRPTLCYFLAINIRPTLCYFLVINIRPTLCYFLVINSDLRNVIF